MNRKELKEKANQDYLKEKEKFEKLKAETISLDKNERKTKLKEYKKEKKEEARERKKNAKKLEDKKLKKEAKRYNKYYKKRAKRKKRIIKWVVVVLILLLLIITIKPYISDILTTTSLSLNIDEDLARSTRENGNEVALKVSDEGLVLLENEDNVLPLTNEKVNVFGFSALNFKYGGAGSGSTDTDNAVTFYEGLEKSGIEYNPDLYDFYTENSNLVSSGDENIWVSIIKGIIGSETLIEPDISYLDDQTITDATNYSDTAIVVVQSNPSEASDLTKEALELSTEERDLIEKLNQNFKDIIIVVNSGNPLELGFLEEYENIKSALWVGTPGGQGAISIGKTLTGELNPSGNLQDTYLYDNDSSPSTENLGNYQYDNIDGIGRLDYEEGIYVGYRYYETYYQNDEDSYKEVVKYPFGYGLSYTTFDQKIVSKSANKNSVSVEVEVKNTGNVAGKETVQVYFSPPYIEGGIEKSAIELAGFDKTKLLEPGQSEKITIEFDTRDMASYDMNDEQAYVLDKGDYIISLNENVHKNYEDFTYKNKNKVVYKEDEVTGTEIKNQFDYANGELTYLSREDFSGTYPSGDDVELTAPDDVVEEFYARPEPAKGEVPTTDADNGIMLEDLKGLEYDDPMWDDYLDQFSFDEMNQLFNEGGYHTTAIDDLGVPEAALLDGPAGFIFLFGDVGIDPASYPAELIISSTWNKDLAYEIGDAVGQEANAYGIDVWYAPAMNIHRVPYGGRNFEYFSEDPLVSGMMGAEMTKGAQDNDIVVTMKHFILNEQEINARTGVMVWSNEQAIRELYLKPFEITVKEGKAKGAMSSFIHVGPKWSGGNPELLKNVLRTEWGFDGLVTTDAVLGSFMDPQLALTNGNELMLAIVPSNNVKKIEKLYEEDPVGIGMGLRDRTHTTLYVLLNDTNAIENYDSTTN